MDYELGTTTKIRSFTDLDVWKEGHKFVVNIYKTTSNFPENEKFGLVSQLRRAYVSITSNIAEGFSKESYKEKVLFYRRSLGSLTETQNQLLVARDVGFMSNEIFKTFVTQTVVISKLLNGIIKKSKDFYS